METIQKPPKKRGPKSLEEKYGEKTTMLKVMVTQSQADYLKARSISIAAYMRKLIDNDRVIRERNFAGSKANLQALTGLEMIIDSLQPFYLDDAELRK